MNFDYEFGKFALLLANSIATVAVAVYTFFATRDKDNSQHIKAVEAALIKATGEHASRLDRVEMQIKFMPTPDQLSELKGDFRSVQATQESIQREMHATRLQLNRIEEFLLKK